eukprot:m.55682 g.55682  ORF g.55682 m.55682 type:complete len:152 (-) comp13335_c0_seq1:196-651(-)
MDKKKRLTKEFDNLTRQPPPNITLRTTDPSKPTWELEMRGAAGTVYDGEVFLLKITFTDKYPFEAPEAVFEGNAPQHPHIYSNGHICLSLLGDDWTPALTVSTLCTSILSMMSSCQRKEWPSGNDGYVQRWASSGRPSPKKTSWWYHDDTM